MASESTNGYLQAVEQFRRERESGGRLQDFGLAKKSGLYLITPLGGYVITDANTGEKYFLVKFGSSVYNAESKTGWRGLESRLDSYFLCYMGFYLLAAIVLPAEKTAAAELQILRYLTAKLKGEEVAIYQALHGHETEVFFISNRQIKQFLSILQPSLFQSQFNIDPTDVSIQKPNKLITYGIRRKFKVIDAMTPDRRRGFDEHSDVQDAIPTVNKAKQDEPQSKKRKLMPNLTAANLSSAFDEAISSDEE